MPTTGMQLSHPLHNHTNNQSYTTNYTTNYITNPYPYKQYYIII